MLNNLNTVINYNSFGKDTNNCAFYPHIIAEKRELDGKFWKNNISDELLNALCYVYIRDENNTKNENLCNYLYYWLGSKILTNLRLEDFFFHVISTIYHILSKEDYETYRLHFINSNSSCDKDYEDAINSYKYLYNDLRKKCFIERTNYHEEYCKAFNNFFTEEKNAQISLWTCQLRETEEQVQQLEKEHSAHVAKEHMPERPVVGGQQVQGDSVQTAQNSRSIVSYLNKELFDRESISSASEESSRSTTTKSITSAVSAAGVLVPPFLIYNVISIVIVQQDLLFYI
ncbi:hypothetical protein PVMG_05976 [Plasmodium vivax Mauritania I]|uniref:Variable surface protein Vir7-like protein n=1 Tax=Plasmodium vivax Mauritania I TaxID=1035515 RepID=A0A0J9TIP1_PLAVI|nr:hypothetical protein PVMG_05976 [Plasmodium vivax Mauritania I]